MTRLLRKLLQVRSAVFAALLLICGLWLVHGPDVVRRLGGAQGPEAFVRKELARLRQIPEAGAFLAQLDETREIRAVAASVRTADRSGGTTAVRRMIAQVSSGHEPCSLSLARLGVQERLFQTEEAREAFAIAHGTSCEALALEPDAADAAGYLQLLSHAAEQPPVWRVVRDDPIALVLWPHLGQEPDLWAFYAEQRDWLAEALVALELLEAQRSEIQEEAASREPEAHRPEPGAQAPVPAGPRLAQAVKAAYRHHPLVRQAVVDEKLGGVGFALFVSHGPVLQQAVLRHGLPLAEVLAVLAPNLESFELPASPEAERNARAQTLAAELAHVRRNKPSVWEDAKRHTLAWRLNKDVPEHAEALLETYGADDIAVFLYASFEREIVPAAAAVAKFGDLAIYILNRYAENQRLHDWLRDPRVGVRIVPFLARFQDEGLDRVDADLAWLDRYFHLDGSPRQDDYAWLEGVPIVGGPANVLRHWSRGEPCEWSELGWAALDIADGALLVMSFGGTSALTAARSGTKTVAVRAGRTAARSAGAGARQAARAGVRRTLLRRIVAAAGGKPFTMVSRTGGVLRGGASTARRGAARVWEAAWQVKTAWQRVPPPIRLWTYRGLLAVGLLITLKERTIPALPQLGEQIGKLAGELVRGSSEAVGAGLAAALREMLTSGEGLPEWGLFLLHAAVAVLLIGATLTYYRSFLRPRVRFL
jgi:hypothetical protein